MNETELRTIKNNMKGFNKIILIAFIAIANCVNAQIVTFINENFNAGFPATWSRINNDGLIPAAAVSFVNDAWVSYEDIDSTGVGDSVAVATSYYSPAGTADDWMITPAITLKGHGNMLKWQVKSQDPSFPDGYDVLISNTLPVMDSFYVNTPLYTVDYELPNWTNRSASLDSFVNQTVFIAFRAKTTNSFLLLIDNINIYADTLVSVHEKPAIATNITAYPNPTNDFVNVNSSKQINKAILMDMSGKVIATNNPISNKFQMQMSALNPGIYILFVICSDGTQSQLKIIRA